MEKTPLTPSSISNTGLIDGVPPLSANGTLRFIRIIYKPINVTSQARRSEEALRKEGGSPEGGREDGRPGRRRRRGAGGREAGAGSGRPGRGGQRRRGGRPRPAPAPPRARRPPVQLHPRQAHQGARPPRKLRSILFLLAAVVGIG